MTATAYDPREKLTADIERAGFYPDLVRDLVDEALAGLEPESHFVQVETHFSHNNLHRHITVLVVSGSLLILAHLDDQHLEEEGQQTVAHVGVEAVKLSSLRAVTISYGYDNPQAYKPGTVPTELSMQIAWTGSLHLELAPATCPDPHCTADHGYSGDASREDLALRVSATADGPEAILQAQQFARALHRAHIQVSESR